jgi:hypothetical protein
MPAHDTASARPHRGVPRTLRLRSLLALLAGCMTLVPALLAVAPSTASAATYPDNVAQPGTPASSDLPAV